YRKKVRQAQKEVHVDEHGIEVVKLKGPWHVHVLSALPLRNLSRLWGYVNSFELPVWFRPYGFKFYAFVFDCNLDEIEQQDLTAYRSLGEFFYRKLKPGVRPVDDAVLVSPADGTILHLGTITDSKVEQVKGITYSLDALLGVDRPSTVKAIVERNPDMEVVDDQEFANVNGIEYTLGQLLAKKNEDEGDASVVEPNASIQDTLTRDVSLVKQVGISTAKGFAPGKPKHERRSSSFIKNARPGHSLFFSVIHLAPGDYHRFHSPTAWVVEKRRHFVGELFSCAYTHPSQPRWDKQNGDMQMVDFIGVSVCFLRLFAILSSHIFGRDEMGA
ncbi:Phosphatidylserine decarboxylase domain containing protein, partial [Amanita muscaria]